MANKYKAFGATFSRKNASAYDAVPNVFSITAPQESVSTIAMTTHDSLGGYNEFQTSFKNGGTSTVSFLFDPADTVQTALRSDFTGNTKNTYKIGLPGPSVNYKITFDAYITAWNPGALEIEGRQEVAVEVTVTGPVTIATT